MKNKFRNIKDFILLIISTIIFYEIFLFSLFYSESEFIFKTNDIFVKKHVEIKMEMNDCELIKRYTHHNILFSQVNHDDISKLIYLYDKCPNEFKDDLVFLNYSKKNQPNIIFEENKFIFFSIKYFYFIDKKYILNQIQTKQYNSNIALLLKEKILNPDL